MVGGLVGLGFFGCLFCSFFWPGDLLFKEVTSLCQVSTQQVLQIAFVKQEAPLEG